MKKIGWGAWVGVVAATLTFAGGRTLAGDRSATGTSDQGTYGTSATKSDGTTAQTGIGATDNTADRRELGKTGTSDATSDTSTSEPLKTPPSTPGTSPSSTGSDSTTAETGIGATDNTADRRELGKTGTSDTSATASTTDSTSTEIHGSVEKFDRSSNTLTVAGQPIKVDSSTEVLKDGNRASLNDIQEGDQVRASFSGSGDAMNAERIEVTTQGSLSSPDTSGTSTGTSPGTTGSTMPSTTDSPSSTGSMGTGTDSPGSKSDMGTSDTKSDTNTGTSGSGRY